MIWYNRFMRLFIFLLAFILVSCSCSEDSPTWDKDEMLDFAREADPDMKIKIGDLSKTLVDCRDYIPRCLIGYRVVLKGLEFNALTYKDQKLAIKAAKRIRGYYSRNWVFDEVRGEPVLERIVIKYLKGKPAF